MSVKAMGAVWDLPLEQGEKLVLLAYADHADHEGGSIYPSIGTISKKTGYSERSVQYITKSLETKGILIPDGQGPKGTNRWRLPMRGGAIIAPAISAPVQPDADGGAKDQSEGVQPIAPEPSLTVLNPEENKSLFWNNRDLSLCWETVKEMIRGEMNRSSRYRLDSCVPISWDEKTLTLTVQADDPDWLNNRAARSVGRMLEGLLNVSDPKIVFCEKKE